MRRVPPSNKKRGLSREQHRQLGLRLARLTDAIDEIVGDVIVAYPINGRQGRAGERLRKAIRSFRFAVEDGCAGEPWHSMSECITLAWPRGGLALAFPSPTPSPDGIVWCKGRLEPRLSALADEIPAIGMMLHAVGHGGDAPRNHFTAEPTDGWRVTWEHLTALGLARRRPRLTDGDRVTFEVTDAGRRILDSLVRP